MAKVLMVVRVESKQFDIAKAIAELQGCNLSEMIRDWLKKEYENNPEIQNKVLEIKR